MSARRELVIAVVALLAEMREAQAQLGHRVDRHAGPPVQLPPQKVTVASFAQGLGKTWQAGERRPIHRRPLAQAGTASTFDVGAYVARIEALLAAQPHLTAVAIVDRLRDCAPVIFGDQQLRTLQRFVQSWRATVALSGGRAARSPSPKRPSCKRQALGRTRHCKHHCASPL